MPNHSVYKENDNIYFNIVIDHPDATFPTNPVTPSSGVEPVMAEYNVSKTIPILNKASDYYCSVIRFDIPLNATPLMIMPIIPNQGDPNLTPMIIGISYNGTTYPIHLSYVADNVMTAPVQNQTKQVISPYYYVYTYQTLITMINVALLSVYTTAGLAALFPTAIQPFFYFDPATDLINLVAHTMFTKVVSPAVARPEIFMNTALINYLEAFEVKFWGYNQPNGMDFTFMLTNPVTPYELFGTTYVYPPYTGTPPNPQIYTADPIYYRYTQEYSIMQYWSSLRKIVITTMNIPVNTEYIPAANNPTSSAPTSFPILTDFVPSVDNAGQSRAIAYYYPTSQYRLIDLLSDDPLKRIDLKIYWEDKDGNLYPLTVSIFQQINVKLAFIKKSLYKNNLLTK